MTPFRRTLLLALALAAPPPSRAAAPADVYGDPLPPGAIARMGSLRLRHAGHVTSAAFSPDGKTLAAASNYGKHTTIQLWDRATGKELRRIPGPDPPVWQLAFSANGKVLAGRALSAIHFWNPATGKPVGPVILDAHDFSRFALSPDGKFLATAPYYDTDKLKDARIRIWDVATGRSLRQLAGHQFEVKWLAFSADGKRLMSGSYGSRTDTGEVNVWDARTWKVLYRFRGAEEPVALSPDGRTVALKSQSQIRLWDLEAEKTRWRLQVWDGVECLFSPDGRLLVGCRSSGVLRVWEVAGGKELVPFRGPGPTVSVLAVSPDGRFLVSLPEGKSGRCYGVKLWDLRRGREACPVGGHREAVSCLAFAPDGRTLLSGSADGTVRLWQTKTGKELRRFEGHRAALTALALSPGGRVAASGDRDGTVRLWDASTGKKRRRLNRVGGAVGSLAFSPDGRELTATSSRGTTLTWDTATGKLLRQFRVGWLIASVAALSPDGTVLAYTERASSVALDHAAGVIHFRGLGPGRALPVIRRTDSWHHSLGFSRDGRFLAAEGYYHADIHGIQDRMVRLWETTTGREVMAIRPEVEGPVAVSPDGRMLFVGGGRGREAAWGCRAWDLLTGKPLGDFRGHLLLAEALAVSSDSSLLATGSADGTILVWDTTRLPRPRLTAPRDLAGPWADLAGPDANRAYQSLLALASAPRRALPFVRQRLRPARSPDPKEVDRLIAALDSESFAERQKAMDGLQKFGELAAPALKALLAGRPSLEVRRRAEQLLARATPPSGEQLQALRAVVVLERIGTPEARNLLEDLAGGAPDARLTQEARASLRRLAAKP